MTAHPRTIRTHSAALAAGLLAILAAAGPAHAQNAEAEGLFREGDKLMASGKDGDLARACDAFEASNRIEPRAGTLIRLGECREKTRQIATAWVAYNDALTRVKDPRKRKIAADRAAALELRLSYLTISVPDESRVDGLVISRNGAAVDIGLWNHAIPIDGGRYVIAGKAPAHEEWSTTIEVPDENGRVSVDVPRFKEIKVLIPAEDDRTGDPAQVHGRDRTADDDALDVDAPGRFTTRRKLALGVAGLGVAALVTGAVLGVQSAGFEDDANALCPADPCSEGAAANALLDRAAARATAANVGYGGGAAALVGAVVLWFTGAPGAPATETRAAVLPRLGGRYAGVDVTVRF